jgi:hypothetical protein
MTMNTQDEERDVFTSHCFEPFPEPQTIPSGWDLSGFLSAPEPFDLAHIVPMLFREGRPVSVTEEDDSTES